MSQIAPGFGWSPYLILVKSEQQLLNLQCCREEDRDLLEECSQTRSGGWEVGQLRDKEDHAALSFSEVMEMVWKIGSAEVKTDQLTGKVHVHWVLSEISQSQKHLQHAVCAFQVF